VVAREVPPTMTSTLLDYRREKNTEKKTSKVCSPPASRAPSETSTPVVSTPPMLPPPPVPANKGPLDFPSISNWLTACEDDLERGRDKHPYKSLAALFAENECTRIDDIVRLSPETIRSLAKDMGLKASFGLVNRIYHYAVEDVARVKSTGKL